MTAADTPSAHLPRLFPRAATDFVVEVYDETGRRLRGISRLLDLSVAGACVDSTSEWGVGERLTVRVLLNGSDLLRLPGAVVWRRAFSKTTRYGLQFSACPEEGRAAIDAYVGDYSTKLSRMGPKNFMKEFGVQED